MSVLWLFDVCASVVWRPAIDCFERLRSAGWGPAVDWLSTCDRVLVILRSAAYTPTAPEKLGARFEQRSGLLLSGCAFSAQTRPAEFRRHEVLVKLRPARHNAALSGEIEPLSVNQGTAKTERRNNN